MAVNPKLKTNDSCYKQSQKRSRRARHRERRAGVKLRIVALIGSLLLLAVALYFCVPPILAWLYVHGWVEARQ
jgi:hypothetical protein